MSRWQDEPTLDEMLADPLIETLMRADGVAAGQLRPALHANGGAGAIARRGRRPLIASAEPRPAQNWTAGSPSAKQAECPRPDPGSPTRRWCFSRLR